jgi:hypothetical protein
MIIKLPDGCLSRLDGMIADASDSDGSPSLVLNFVVTDEDGEEPSDEEKSTINAIIEAWAEDGPFDDRGHKGSDLRKQAEEE